MTARVFITPTSSLDVDELIAPIRKCFDQFGSVHEIVKGKVFIKINATAIEPNAITTPEVILATVKVLKESGINPRDIYVFDNSAFGMPTRVVFKMGNLARKIKKLGANPLYLDEQESMDLDFKGKALDKPVPIPKILYENLVQNKLDNTYINIPKLKTHLATGITVCIKNQQGLLYDEEKLYHHHMMNDKIVEIYRVFQPDFNIVDATIVLNNGATSFSKDWLIPMNLLLAGTDAVAVDTIAAELIGIPYANVKYLKMASDRKLGCSSIKQIEILPNREILKDRKIVLNDIFEKIEIDMAENFQIIVGKDHPGCRAGCKSMLEYFKLMTVGGKIRPIVSICGRGHDIKELDKIQGSVLVTGECAVKELKNYFENRPDRDKLNIFYMNDHFGITEFITPFRKASKISIRQLSVVLKLSFFKIIVGYIVAKLKKAKFKSIF